MLLEILDAVLVGHFPGYPVQYQRRFQMRNSDPPTFKRYSTARSGLKKAALIARSMSALGNPILSMFATAASLCAPSVSADGSLKFPPSLVAAAVVAGAGDGVAGAFPEAALKAGAAAGAGAGAEGVCATLEAGVEGGLEDAEALVFAGAALGYRELSFNSHLADRG